MFWLYMWEFCGECDTYICCSSIVFLSMYVCPSCNLFFWIWYFKYGCFGLFCMTIFNCCMIWLFCMVLFHCSVCDFVHKGFIARRKSKNTIYLFIFYYILYNRITRGKTWNHGKLEQCYYSWYACFSVFSFCCIIWVSSFLWQSYLFFKHQT